MQVWLYINYYFWILQIDLSNSGGNYIYIQNYYTYIYIYFFFFPPVPSRIVQIYLPLQDLSCLLSEVSGHCPCCLVPNTLPSLSSTRMKPGLEPQLHWCPDLEDIILPSFELRLNIMPWDMGPGFPTSCAGWCNPEVQGSWCPVGQTLTYERLQMGGWGTDR